MSDPTMFPPRPFTPQLKSKSADWGGKALLVCLLALLMTIPGLFVWALIKDRADRSEGVVQAVSAQQGGAQQVLGPVLVAPWQVVHANKDITTGWYVVSPETGAAQVKVKTETLKRGIFEVPAYHATADLNASFGPQAPPASLPEGAVVDWSRAKLVVGFSDLRGAKEVRAILKTAAGETQLAFTPASDISLGSATVGQAVSDSEAYDAVGRASRAGTDNRFGLMAAPAAALLAAPEGASLKAQLVFTGAQRLSVVPFAKSTTVNIDGDWSAPSFDGGFLPENRDTAGSGFKASWRVPFVARGLVEHGPTTVLSLSDLGQRDLGVTFKRTNNPYQNVMRALKYAVMFVGLVFLTFFVFEALSGSRLHPAQYVLIGLAQMTFYLLLLSLSEYIGFDAGFAIAAVATVALIGLYAGAAFRAKRYAFQALVIFSIVYGLIYLLMRLEDFALLAGSIAAFAGLSVAMWLTRNIDWYGGKAEVIATGSQLPQEQQK